MRLLLKIFLYVAGKRRLKFIFSLMNNVIYFNQGRHISYLFSYYRRRYRLCPIAHRNSSKPYGIATLKRAARRFVAAPAFCPCSTIRYPSFRTYVTLIIFFLPEAKAYSLHRHIRDLFHAKLCNQNLRRRVNHKQARNAIIPANLP